MALLCPLPAELEVIGAWPQCRIAVESGRTYPGFIYSENIPMFVEQRDLFWKPVDKLLENINEL